MGSFVLLWTAHGGDLRSPAASHVGVSDNRGTLFGGPCNKDPIIPGCYIRVPYFRKLPWVSKAFSCEALRIEMPSAVRSRVSDLHGPVWSVSVLHRLRASHRAVGASRRALIGGRGSL